MKTAIMTFLKDTADEIAYSIRTLCGKPSPMKRFVFVLIISGVLSVFFIYTLVSSIYNIGRNDARKELLDTGDTLNDTVKSDSIGN